MSRFLEALRSSRVLLMDGATGTELQRAGLQPGECGELWNLTHPERVRAIHQAYVDAGAEVLLTNTFLTNPATLRKHQLAEKCEAICQAAVEHARLAAGHARWVLGDIGPCQFEDEYQALPRLVAALVNSGVDGLLVETCSEPGPLARVLKALAEHHPGNDTPVLVSLTYQCDRDSEVKTVGAMSPRKMARWLESYRIAALGMNCGRDMGMPQVLDVVEQYRDNTFRRVFVRPNAGTPRRVADGWAYPHSPEYMASWVPGLLEAGVCMVGGCCGTTPAHIAAFRKVIEEWNARQASHSP
jgi:5-methyltetrahydrofolate--homocysteine methyltransferase